MNKNTIKKEKQIKFKTIVDNIDDVTRIGLNTSNLVCVRRNTPRILLKNIPNIKNYPMLMKIGKLKSAIGIESKNRNTHHISKEFAYVLPKLLAKPNVIFYHASQHSYNLVNYDGKIPVIISIKPNLKGKYNDIIINTNKIATLFNIDKNIEEYFEQTISKVIYPDATKKEVISIITTNVVAKIDLPSNLKVSSKDNDVK